MKVIPFILALILFNSNHLFSQKKFALTPQIGFVATPIKNISAEGTVWKPSLHAGIDVDIFLNERWDLRTGLSISNTYSIYSDTTDISPLGSLESLLGDALSGILDGANLVSEEQTEGRSSSWNIDLPIAFQYNIKSGFYMRFGAFGSYMMANTNKEKITTHVPVFEVFQLEQLGLDAFEPLFPKNETRYEVNQSREGLNEFGWGALLQVGYEGPVWTFNAGYQYAFSKIRNDGKSINVGNRQGFFVTVGHRFYPDFSTSKMKPKYDLDLIK